VNHSRWISDSSRGLESEPVNSQTLDIGSSVTSGLSSLSAHCSLGLSACALFLAHCTSLLSDTALPHIELEAQAQGRKFGEVSSGGF
jgi:hypothetical protein